MLTPELPLATTAGLVLFALLAVLAQARRRCIRPPRPLAERVAVEVRHDRAGVHVRFRGRGVLALSFHAARWRPPVEVTRVEGPLTLVHREDVRLYVLASLPDGPLVLDGVWEQLSLRRLTLQVDVAAGAGAEAVAARAAAAPPRR